MSPHTLFNYWGSLCMSMMVWVCMCKSHEYTLFAPTPTYLLCHTSPDGFIPKNHKMQVVSVMGVNFVTRTENQH